MSGVSGLVDTLLAERLSQRADLVALKSAFVVQGPGPAGRIQGVANDVRIQAEAAKQQQAGLGGSGNRPPVTGEASILLSSAARVIARLLSLVPEGGAPPVAGRTLLPAPANMVEAAAAAKALQTTVTSSGLFYESHLAGLAAGQLALADMQSEPQMRWLMQGAEISRALAGEAGALQREGVGNASTATAAGQSLSLIHQQLELLASGVFRWIGEAWPGVPMQLAIEPEHQERDESADAAASCSASFSLDLPALGTVEIMLRLTAAQNGHALVRATVVAEPQAARGLTERLEDVTKSLASAGFASSQVAVTPRTVAA